MLSGSLDPAAEELTQGLSSSGPGICECYISFGYLLNALIDDLSFPSAHLLHIQMSPKAILHFPAISCKECSP